ncbi:hypothetical protein LINPERPRIM_LOCUS38430 [Linum perenne]
MPLSGRLRWGCYSYWTV